MPLRHSTKLMCTQSACLQFFRAPVYQRLEHNMIKERHDVVVYLERVADRIQHNHRFSVLNMCPVFLYWREFLRRSELNHSLLSGNTSINAYLPHTLVCSCCHVFLCLSSSLRSVGGSASSLRYQWFFFIRTWDLSLNTCVPNFLW